ncbi:UNVERIFIED_ORG: hypothetical protein J2X79_001993 [Arthrobacter globiformis]|nr:hypothetical protein [Arthrobacter globiformis]
MNDTNAAETTPPDSGTVTAIYELPVPIWVSSAALGATYPSGYGKVQFDVAMPQDRAAVGAPPVVEGVEVPDSIDGELLEWTTEYAADVPEEFQPATALRRIIITAVEAPTDSARSWRGPDQQLGECIKFWFNQVRSWVEIFTSQDLDPNHRVYDAETVGAGLTFIAPTHEGDLGLQLITRHIQPVTAAQWQVILAAVRDGKEPPLEPLLIRDANAAFARGFYRRAVIDAAAALELTLVRVLDERIEDLPDQQRKRLKGATLGRYIDIANASGLEFDVTFEDLKHLNDARNDAVHRAEAPDYFGTVRLLHVVGDFLGTSVRFKDASTTE